MEEDLGGNEKPDFVTALTVGHELGLKLPDSQVVRDAYGQAEDESQPWLFNHVMRSWLYGAKLAQRRGLTPDAELVAVSVLLHDLGLARGGAPDRRFEVLAACRTEVWNFAAGLFFGCARSFFHLNGR
jgi:hypothetical protein